MAELTAFEIHGLFGSRNVRFDLTDPALIIVGPNGLGKSNAASIFYLFTTRQWSRLLEHSFMSISAEFGDEKHILTRQDISGIFELSEILNDRRLSPNFRRNLSKLQDAGELESFLEFTELTSLNRKRIAGILEMPTSELIRFRSFIRSRLSSVEEFKSPSRAAINELLTEVSERRTIYLPTFRRIEKELKQVFPDFEERMRHVDSALNPRLAAGNKHFIDLVSFGMEDVKSAINARLEYLRNYSLVQFNSLSGTYLRDVIRGRATAFKMSQIRSLDDDTLSTILNRVSDATLSPSDKAVLKERIGTIRQAKRKSDIDLNDQYLVHYFSRLMEVYEDIRLKESEVSAFVDVCNNYLNPSKYMKFDDGAFEIRVYDEEERDIDLSLLSSGEKQIVSLFAHLYLEGNSNNIIIIDEPELSLSVPWQKRFLPDLMASGRCKFILAVTHSPFIYQNKLKYFAHDFRNLEISNE